MTTSEFDRRVDHAPRAMPASAFDRLVGRALIALLWGGTAAAHRAIRRAERELDLRPGLIRLETLLESVP